jgi:protein TonB
MEIKKSKNADLEGKRIGFIALGLIFSASIVFMAFTHKTVSLDKIKKELAKEDNSMEEEFVEEFLNPETPPPPPEPAQLPPPVIEEVEEVEDDVEVEVVETVDESLIDLSQNFEEEEKIEPTVIMDIAEVSPEYPGGAGEMATFIQDNFEYPEIAREMGEQGTVWIEFVVYKDGSIKDTKVVKGVSKTIDAEALRVVKRMPKWKPGEQAGKSVNVRYTIPIKVRLG